MICIFEALEKGKITDMLERSWDLVRGKKWEPWVFFGT